MSLKLKLNGKLLLYILGTTLILYTTTIGFIAYRLLNVSRQNGLQSVSVTAQSATNQVTTFLSAYAVTAQNLSEAFSKLETTNPAEKVAFIEAVSQNVLNANPGFYAVWTKWADTTIGTTGVMASPEGLMPIDIATLNQNRLQHCNELSENGQTLFCEPTEINYTENKQLITGIVTPVYANGELLGVVGIDIKLEAIRSQFASYAPVPGCELYIVSNQGSIVSNPHETLNLQPAITVFAKQPGFEKNFQAALSGEASQFLGFNPITKAASLYALQPLAMENGHNWVIIASIPGSQLFTQTNKALVIILITGLIGLLILTWAINMLARSISRPLKRNTQSLRYLANGQINQVQSFKYPLNDEIGDINNSISQLVTGLKAAANFATQIGKGNLEVEYKLLGPDDSLGNSLLKMRESLKKAKVDADRKKVEDEKRNWVTHGLAKFGEIIRQDNNNMDKFSMNVIRHLAEYLDAAQIAIYINEKNEYEDHSLDVFHLKAALAYNKPVKITRSVELGKELIGYATLVNKTVNITQLPESYAALSPGMKSQKRPSNLLIAPITNNDQPLGAFEILSYHPFEPHHIDFIEKLSENIAAVIASVKVNIRTAKLLEQSQFQADELAQHEEEMRQNLEEMLATQEEAQKRYNLLSSYIKAVKGAVITAELDLKGRILEVSPAMTILFGASRESMVGNFYDAFTIQSETDRTQFSDFWEKMLRNGRGKRMQIYSQRKKEYYLLESYMVIKKEGLTPRVLLVITDRSRLKELNERLKSELHEE